MRIHGLKAAVLTLFLLIPAFLLFRPTGAAPAAEHQSPGHAFESHVRARMPFEDAFGQIRRELYLLGGRRELNGIFLTESGLIRRIGPINDDIVQANIGSVLSFADSLAGFGADDIIPVFVALLPSSAAILEESLPPFSNTINQRQFIEGVYSALLGRVSVISVFETLSGNRHEYIFYRTHDNFTSLGGYYIYTQLHMRMLGLAAPTLAAFDLSHPSNNFLGDLYHLSPYRGVHPDTITLFHWSSYNRQHIVTHTGPGGRRVYHTLFPEHMASLGRPMDVFLGGLSPVTDIYSSVPYERSLLILGDSTALAYAPFLANHYRRITIIDIFEPSAIAPDILARNYSQVLIAAGVDTFMTRELPAETLEHLAIDPDF